MTQQRDIAEVALKRRSTGVALAAAAVCALVLAVGVGVHAVNLSDLAKEELAQQTAQTITVDDKSDKTTTKQVAVPLLTSFIGMTQDDVVEELGTSAKVTATRAVKDADTAVRTEVSVALTGEAANSTAGTPTVHLGLNEDGDVIQAGYTVNLRLLGYGSISFIDAVENYHVIYNTLYEGGLAIPEDSVVLPDTKAAYAVYGADGITLAREDYTFEGTSAAGYAWEGELVYDYTQANAEGNLAYTVRLVTVTVIAQR